MIGQQNTAVTASLPAPIGGWNARDSLAAMPQTDAVNLTNFWPTPTDVELRKGWTVYSTGISGTINTMMTYASPAGHVGAYTPTVNAAQVSINCYENIF